MKSRATRHGTRGDRDELSSARSRRLPVIAGFAILGTISLLTGAASLGSQAPGQNTDKPYLSAQANRLPDANDQMKREPKQVSLDSPDATRKKELANESAQLLTLAIALKAEVDKTNKDMLSLNVIRKADEIEKLAHNVKAKMKLTAGGG